MYPCNLNEIIFYIIKYLSSLNSLQWNNLGGDILAQQHNKNSIVISVLSDFLQISLGGPGVIGPNNRIDVKYPYQLLDNRWHTLQFKYEYGNLYLYVDRTSRVFGK